MTIIELITHPGFLVGVGCFVLVFLVFIISTIINNYKLNAMVQEYANFHNARDFIIKIDTSRADWRISVYMRRKGVYRTVMSLSDFRPTIHKMDQGVFESYVSNCLLDKKLPKLVVRHVAVPFTIRTSKIFRREYVPLRHVRDTVFFRCQEFVLVGTSNQKNQILPLGEFKRALKGCTREDAGIQGTLLCFKILNMEQILSRYNIGITNQFTQVIATRLNRFAVESDCLVAQDEDRYYLYSKVALARKEATQLLREFKVHIETPVTLAGFKLTVAINVGVAFFGEFSSVPQVVVGQAEQALEQALGLGNVIDSYIYDQQSEMDNQRRQKNYEKVGRIVHSRSFSPVYAPIINIENDKTIGYRITFTPDSHFLNIDEIKQYSREINLVDELNDSLAHTALSHFYFKKGINRDLIFIETTLEECRKYAQVYQQNPDYGEISLALVLTDYQSFHRRDLDPSLIELIKSNQIALYAYAHPLMLLSDHQIFNHLDGIVFGKEILEMSEQDDIYKLEMIKINDRFQDYNYRYIAFDINNNPRFEIVNSLGITYIEGKLVGLAGANPVPADGVNFRRRALKSSRKRIN